MNYEDRDYQERAITWLCKTRRGILQAATASGKTVIVGRALNRVIESKPRNEKVKIGWLCHTIEQAGQAGVAIKNSIEDHSKVDVKIRCAAAETDWSDRHILVVDECHRGSCHQWSSQIEKCNGARWACSATPLLKSDSQNQKLLEMFDGNVFIIQREEVKNFLTSARVVILNDTDSNLAPRIDAMAASAYHRRQRFWKGQDWELQAQTKWRACMEIGIAGNNARNLATINLAIKHSADHVLVLVNNIEHGEVLQQQIPGSHLCFSKMGKKLRGNTIEKLKSGEINCVIGTSLFDEGMDVPIIDTVVMVCGGRSEIKTIQRTGRALRQHEGKSVATIYDFADSWHPMAHNHFKSRMAVYRKLKYQIGETDMIL